MKVESPVAQTTARIDPALVVEVDPNNARVLVQGENAGPGETLWCRMATDGIESLGCGDEVLVAGAGAGGGYVIGLLDRPREPVPDAASTTREICMPDGVRAVADGAPEAPVLTIFNPDGTPVFDYHTDTGVMRMRAGGTDIRCEVDGGDMRIRAAGTLSFAGRRIAMDADEEILMRTGAGSSPLLSSMRLSTKGIQMLGLDIVAFARRALFRIRETQYAGQVFESRLEDVRYTVGRLRGEAREVVSTAGSVYTTVKGLSQICASRMRAVVRGNFHLSARSTNMRSEEDTFIDGEKIHLG